MKIFFMTLFLGCFLTFTGCSEKSIETTWSKLETIHEKVESAGGALIDANIITGDTAEALKEINTKVVEAGTLAEDTYVGVKDIKDETVKEP